MVVLSYLIYAGYLAVAVALVFFVSNEMNKGGAMKVVRALYVLAIMAFIIMVVSFGISAFYEGPEYTGYSGWQGYEEDQSDYARNVFSISYPIGIVFVLLGVTLRPRLDLIRPGLVLGGLGTIIYAISQPHLVGEIRFTGVVVGLAILIFVGYRMLLERKTNKDDNVNTVT